MKFTLEKYKVKAMLISTTIAMRVHLSYINQTDIETDTFIIFFSVITRTHRL